MKKKPLVFLNASVILAGLNSPMGGSAAVLNLSKQGIIKGFISEVVLDETKRHADKIGLNPNQLEQKLRNFVKIAPAPKRLSKTYYSIVLDMGDIHLFTSAEELKVDYLISLDKKHILSLIDRIKIFSILSPGEFLEKESKLLPPRTK